MIQSKVLLWVLVALLYCFCFSSSYAQNLNTGTACPNLYSGSTQAYTVPSGVTYSTGVICNETSTQDLLGSSILTIDIPNDSNGNPIGAYNVDTDTFTFNSNGANVAQKATFAINAALQAAGVGIQFRGFKYEWEMIKPTASSTFTIGVKIYSNTNEGLIGGGVVYQNAHSYTGTAFSDWTSRNSGYAGTPPFKFVVKDDWTVEAQITSNSDNNQLRGLKYTWTYNPVVGHENDFSTTYVYPGQEAAEQSDFDYQCSINPQFNPGCPGYTDPSINTGETTTTAELNTGEDQIASSGITTEISNSALQSGTNIDGTLNTEVVDLGVMPEGAPLMDGTEMDLQGTDSIILDIDSLEIGITTEITDITSMLLITQEVDMNNSIIDLTVPPGETLNQLNIECPDCVNLEILDMPMPIMVEIPMLEEMITTLPEIKELGLSSIILPVAGAPSMLPEISEQGEVSTSLTGKLSTVPDLIELELESTAPPILNIAGPSIEPGPAAVSVTGTISPTASLPRALTSIQRDALSVASTTTSAAINITSIQSRASITSGDSQVAYSSSSDASGTSSNSGSDGGFNVVQNNDGSSSNNNNQAGNQQSSQSGGQGSSFTNGDSNSNSNNDPSSRNTGSNNFGTLSDGNININSIASDNSIASLNQSGPQGVFSAEDTGGASNVNEDQLAIGNTSVSYEESNEIMFGAVVIPQLDFTIREMIDSIIKRIFADAGMISDTKLDEVSESELKQQQNIEDNLVKDALGGVTTEDAQAALLGYNPLFRSYVVPQIYDQVATLYQRKDIYTEQKTYDNPHARFFNGASDELHRRMVRQQYGDK